MVDYKKMYHILLHEVDTTIEKLKEALIKAENFYIENGGDELEAEDKKVDMEV